MEEQGEQEGLADPKGQEKPQEEEQQPGEPTPSSTVEGEQPRTIGRTTSGSQLVVWKGLGTIPPPSGETRQSLSLRGG